MFTESILKERKKESVEKFIWSKIKKKKKTNNQFYNYRPR